MPSLDDYPVSSCNCSLCTRWGYLNQFVWKDDLEIEGEDQLKEYEFGQKRMTHKFCGTCSTNMFVYQTEIPQLGDVRGWLGLNVCAQFNLVLH